MSEDKKWKVLERTYLFNRPWLTARRDKVLLPTGAINDEYYILEYPTWVNVIAINKEGKYIMVEQYRHGLEEVFTELVAGVVEKDETPLAGAKRELLEETGFGGGNWELLTVISANPGSFNNLAYCYLATDVEPVGEQHLDETEDVTVKFLSESEVRRMLYDDEVKQALMAAPLWKYFATRINNKS